ncbi:MAG: hypothetical protein ACD_39C00934G0001 [uncultured bacterium]|nr:MAG: hypothetical protein ACD_39C00934G0001 [uncultured bacterium]
MNGMQLHFEGTRSKTSPNLSFESILVAHLQQRQGRAHDFDISFQKQHRRKIGIIGDTKLGQNGQTDFEHARIFLSGQTLAP